MIDTAVASHFLRTKLYRPLLPEDHIPRPQLLAKLDAIGNRGLTMLTAPAGYGKTTLLCAWIEQTAYPCAWISLDEGDNDPVVFLRYFVAAIRSIAPDFGAEFLKYSRGVELPSLPLIINQLVSEIDWLEQDIVLVLDDYHVLTQPEIHELLDGLLHYPLPQLHLALTSRINPPLRLSKLRANDRVMELRATELRFSVEEVASFTAKTLASMPDPQIIRILAEKTEGWPVGLRLATIAIRRWGIVDPQPAILQVENQYVTDYLVNEVLTRQPRAVRDFLLKSSILNRFCTDLCAAVMGTESLDPVNLRQLEREGLFIESLDSHGEWYRYHQLFRELLHHRLVEMYSTAEVAVLHLRASTWLADHDFIEEAIDQALLAGDLQMAAKILSAHSIALMNEERWLQLEIYLNKFPLAAIQKEPILLLLLTWLNLARWRLVRLKSMQEQLEGLLKTTSRSAEETLFIQTSAHVFASCIFTWSADFEKVVEHARAALAAAPREWVMLRTYAWIYLVMAMHFLQDRLAALAMLTEDEATGWMEADEVRARKQIAKCFSNWLSADLPLLLQTANQGLTLTKRLHLFFSSSFLHMFAGSAYYQQNKLDQAAHHFNLVLELSYAAHPACYVLSVIGMALICEAQHMMEEAWQLVETAVQFCLERDYPTLYLTVNAFQAELALRHGQLDRATHLAAQIDTTSQSKVMPYPYQPQMVRPKIWLAEGTPDSRQRAETELLRLQEMVTSTHNVRYQIEVLALQALLFQAQNKPHAAEETLTQALRLAQPSRYIRIFVDLGPDMALLLNRLYTQSVAAPIYLQQILGAFPVTKPIIQMVSSQALVEPLTEREMEVLALLAQRLSNNEIANILVISPETVKRHTINIYQKLGVNKRRQAVTKGYELGLLADLA